MSIITGVSGADNERQSATDNYQAANDVVVRELNAIMQGDESQDFQLVTVRSLKTRFVSFHLF